jgi:hypothetical protein
LPGGDSETDVDALGVLHLFEGGCTIRGLTIEDSFWGILLGWHYGFDWDERRPRKEGGFLVEGNVFRNSQNGVRGSSAGTLPILIRDNVFENVHFGVSTLGSGWVIEGNHFLMPDAQRAQGHGDAVRMSAEHVAGDCSDNAVLDNLVQGHESGVAIYTDGQRKGTGNVIRGARWTDVLLLALEEVPVRRPGRAPRRSCPCVRRPRGRRSPGTEVCGQARNGTVFGNDRPGSRRVRRRRS